jgi:hypothetical protein
MQHPKIQSLTYFAESLSQHGAQDSFQGDLSLKIATISTDFQHLLMCEESTIDERYYAVCTDLTISFEAFFDSRIPNHFHHHSLLVYCAKCLQGMYISKSSCSTQLLYDFRATKDLNE